MARSLSSILSSIHEMSDTNAPKDVFAMLYAEFGVGKTTTTMGLAQAIRGDGKILFLDSSDGWVSLQEFPALMEGTDRFRANDPKDLIVIANALQKGQMKGYSVVVIDELSSIFDEMLEQYLREKNGLSPDEQIPEADGRDYGPPTAALSSLLRKFHEIEGTHLLVTAHAREVQAEGGNKEIRPSFPPKAYAEVMRKTHITAALTARRKRNPDTKELDYVRTLQLKPSAAVAAKSRLPNSPINCTPDEFITLVSEWVESEDFVQDTQHESVENEVIEDLPEEPEEIEADDVDTEDAELDLDGLVDEVIGEEPEPEKAPVNDVPQLFIGVDTEIPSRETRAKVLKAFTVKELRDYVSSQWDLDTAGVKKEQLIEGILALEYDADEEGGE